MDDQRIGLYLLPVGLAVNHDTFHKLSVIAWTHVVVKLGLSLR